MLDSKTTDDTVFVYPTEGKSLCVRATFATFNDAKAQLESCPINLGWPGSGAIPGETIAYADRFAQAIQQAIGMAMAAQRTRFPEKPAEAPAKG